MTPFRIPGPYVASVSPASGDLVGGITVTLTGLYFTTATGVTFGGNPATSFTVVNDGDITAVVPAGQAQAFDDVQVTTLNGVSPVLDWDKYEYTPPAPTLTSVSPPSGSTAGGDVVAIGGTNLTGATVFFGGIPATQVTVNSDSSITADRSTWRRPAPLM